jgi:hypothetical protein
MNTARQGNCDRRLVEINVFLPLLIHHAKKTLFPRDASRTADNRIGLKYSDIRQKHIGYIPGEQLAHRFGPVIRMPEVKERECVAAL